MNYLYINSKAVLSHFKKKSYLEKAAVQWVLCFRLFIFLISALTLKKEPVSLILRFKKK